MNEAKDLFIVYPHPPKNTFIQLAGILTLKLYILVWKVENTIKPQVR